MAEAFASHPPWSKPYVNANIHGESKVVAPNRNPSDQWGRLSVGIRSHFVYLPPSMTENVISVKV